MCPAHLVWPFLALALASRALAYPTSLNLMPVADSLEAGTLRLEVELDGDPTPFATGTGWQVYTQYGITDRLEVGLDVVDVNLGSRCQLNAKWVVAPESNEMPALAVGLLEANHGAVSSDWYVVLSKDVSPVRVHAGALSDDSLRGMLGAEYWFGEDTGVAADWATGPGAYHSLGVYQHLGGGLWGTLYYGRGNTSSDGGFVGLNVLWEGQP
jgi:hypothetical protein